MILCLASDCTSVMGLAFKVGLDEIIINITVLASIFFIDMQQSS